MDSWVRLLSFNPRSATFWLCDLRKVTYSLLGFRFSICKVGIKLSHKVAVRVIQVNTCKALDTDPGTQCEVLVISLVITPTQLIVRHHPYLPCLEWRSPSTLLLFQSVLHTVARGSCKYHTPDHVTALLKTLFSPALEFSHPLNFSHPLLFTWVGFTHLSDSGLDTLPPRSFHRFTGWSFTALLSHIILHLCYCYLFSFIYIDFHGKGRVTAVTSALITGAWHII